jgi:hypothetical protein
LLLSKRELRSGFYAGELGCTSGTATEHLLRFMVETTLQHETTRMQSESGKSLKTGQGGVA